MKLLFEAPRVGRQIAAPAFGLQVWVSCSAF